VTVVTRNRAYSGAHPPRLAEKPDEGQMNQAEDEMTEPIQMNVISQTSCAFDATFKVPPAGALLTCQAKGKDSSNGNWTSIGVTVTEIDTGAVYTNSARNDSELVELHFAIRVPGRYQVHAVQGNFRETCEYTIVSGRKLETGFFG
jgi:hypothetical protein